MMIMMDDDDDNNDDVMIRITDDIAGDDVQYNAVYKNLVTIFQAFRMFFFS